MTLDQVSCILLTDSLLEVVEWSEVCVLELGSDLSDLGHFTSQGVPLYAINGENTDIMVLSCQLHEIS